VPPFDRRPGPPPDSGGLRINAQIRAREVRLVNADGEMVGVVPLEEALRQAQEADLDLVEIAPTATPPVCKILDYGKYKYAEQKKQKAPKRKQIKELRLRPATDEHDFETKVNHARRFIEKDFKVLVTMMFRGRQMAHTEIGRDLLAKFAKAVEDIAKVEQSPRQEGYRMQMTLVPK
jgi:translation initiation factor IF-3